MKSLLGSFSVLFYQNLLRMVILINFHLFSPTPSIECSFFVTISVKNQARLTQKMVDSYLRVFTVFSYFYFQLFFVSSEVIKNLN